MTNKFIYTQNLGVFLGKITDNTMHKHYAIQITISLGNDVFIKTESTIHKSISCIIKPLFHHQLDCNNQNVLLILINPASKVGHFINHHILEKNIDKIDSGLAENLKLIGNKWSKGKIDAMSFLEQFHKIMNAFISDCELKSHVPDKRIKNAIDILEKHTQQVIPLDKIAQMVCLSPSRFIHLFKSETGISYRRMQLWFKLMKSFDLFQKTKTLTSLAHSAGFSDSAHYARTFKETFGISPSIFRKMLNE